MLKEAFLALVLICISSGAYVAPRIYEQDDLGDPMFDEFVYSISVDCTAATIRLIVMDEEYQGVQDAKTYLKYVDFASPLLSNVVTDKDGFTLHKLPGQTTLMRGLFILVMEKKGFRSKEVHFDISPCYSDYTFPSPPPKQEEPAQNGITPPENDTVADVPAEPPVQEDAPPADGSLEEENGEEPAPALCPLSFALLIMFLKTIKP